MPRVALLRAFEAWAEFELNPVGAARRVGLTRFVVILELAPHVGSSPFGFAQHAALLEYRAGAYDEREDGKIDEVFETLRPPF